MPNTPHILITLSSFAEHNRKPLQLLESSGCTVKVNPHGRRLKPAEIVPMAKDSVGIIAGVEPYDAVMLAQLPHLRCISRCGSGLDAIDLEAARVRGIQVLATPDEPVDAVAEHTLALLLALLRRIPHAHASMQNRSWKRPTTTMLAGKIVGVIGLGRIGRRVAELLSPFRVRVLGADPVAPDPDWARAVGLRTLPLADILALADVITLHAAAGPGQPPLLGPREFAQLKRGAYLINTARGQLVDETALEATLRSGHVAGAALDVFSEEPYRGPLCDLDNVLLTPHQASSTIETRAAMELRAVQNLLAALPLVVRP